MEIATISLTNVILSVRLQHFDKIEMKRAFSAISAISGELLFFPETQILLLSRKCDFWFWNSEAWSMKFPETEKKARSMHGNRPGTLQAPPLCYCLLFGSSVVWRCLHGGFKIPGGWGRLVFGAWIRVL
jgi:hypothetical protein